jgi:hypothetical protein
MAWWCDPHVNHVAHAVVAIPNDPSNCARALLLLQKQAAFRTQIRKAARYLAFISHTEPERLPVIDLLRATQGDAARDELADQLDRACRLLTLLQPDDVGTHGEYLRGKVGKAFPALKHEVLS